MIAYDEVVCHFGRDAAMGQKDLVLSGIDERRVGHKARLADQFPDHKQ